MPVIVLGFMNINMLLMITMLDGMDYMFYGTTLMKEYDANKEHMELKFN